MTPKITIVIPTYNNVAHLKLLIDSIEKNSMHSHEIMPVSDCSQDETVDYLKRRGGPYEHLAENTGVCTAINTGVEASDNNGTSHIMIINDDMFMPPGWDTFLPGQLAKDPENYVISGTLVEPAEVEDVAPAFIGKDFGSTWNTFDAQAFSAWYTNEHMPGLNNENSVFKGISNPHVLNRKLFYLVGAMDTDFNAGPANDPDFYYRLAEATEHLYRDKRFMAYHFQGKAANKKYGLPGREKKRAEGRKKFIEKWGFLYDYSLGAYPRFPVQWFREDNPRLRMWDKAGKST